MPPKSPPIWTMCNQQIISYHVVLKSWCWPATRGKRVSLMPFEELSEQKRATNGQHVARPQDNTRGQHVGSRQASGPHWLCLLLLVPQMPTVVLPTLPSCCWLWGQNTSCQPAKKPQYIGQAKSRQWANQPWVLTPDGQSILYFVLFSNLPQGLCQGKQGPREVA